ncbi:MAG: radical SAM protein [Promethearchaeota archaeon]
MKYIDTWFWNLFTMNPYRGCEHACEYCDSRSHKYHLHEDPDQTIYVKVNAPVILQKELNKLGHATKTLLDFGVKSKTIKIKQVIAMSGITDAYQPAEAKYKITRKCLRILKNYGIPVHIITKSDLVLRDLELLSEINDKSWACVSLTITTFDKKLVRLFEPRVPSPTKRLNTIKTLAENGINTGVMLCPTIPYILDTEKNMETIIKNAKSVGAHYVLSGAGMTLREGQKERFLQLLKIHYPELIAKYESLFDDWAPNKKYMLNVFQRAFNLCRKHKINPYIKRPHFNGVLDNNYRISTFLYMIAYFLELRGENLYKIIAYKNAAESIQKLTDDIIDIQADEKLHAIPNIGQSISKIISEIIENETAEYIEKLKL